IADIGALKAAVEARDSRQLLQVLLPVKSSFELDLIKIVDPEGRLLADVENVALGTANLHDEVVLQRAQKGLMMTSLLAPTRYVSQETLTQANTAEEIATQEAAARKAISPVLIKTLSVESSQADIGSIMVGYILTPEVLLNIIGAGRQQIVLLKKSQVIATTIPGNETPSGSMNAAISDSVDWSKQSSTIQKVTVLGVPYLSKTVDLPKIADNQFQAVVLTPLTAFRASQRQMWLLVGSFGTLGGFAMVLIGLGVTNLITKRITELMRATQNLAKGDLTVRLPVTGTDEVAALANGFNDMAEQLKHRDAKIKHQVGELEHLVRELQQMPQQVHTAKMAGLGQMVAGVAHEINNPVGFIYSNITPAKEYVSDIVNLLNLYQKHVSAPPEEIQQQEDSIDLSFIQTDLFSLLDSMQLGAQRIKEIVLSLRNFSRKDESKMKAVNLNDGLDSTLVVLNYRLKAQPDLPAIKVVRDYSALPAVHCFAGEINQAFMNVINNAIDAIDNKLLKQADTTIDFSPQIRIQTDAIGDDAVVVRITNNGFPIPQEIRGRLFDPFFTTKAVGEGTGLGLAISYQIVTEKHGGKIWCDSSSDCDTEFVIQLPIVRSIG
ncbi:MAG: ATP-binding protein, partial [Cyanobacteria bacterium J06560_2]